jgi:hypothetical protein
MTGKFYSQIFFSRSWRIFFIFHSRIFCLLLSILFPSSIFLNTIFPLSLYQNTQSYNNYIYNK